MRQHFASANENTKLVRDMCRLVRRARLDYEGFRRVCAQVRRQLELQRPLRYRHLTRVLPEASLRRLYEAIQAGQARARAAGKDIGRPKVVVDRAEVVKLREEGLSWAEIAARMGVDAGTVPRAQHALNGSL